MKNCSCSIEMIPPKIPLKDDACRRSSQDSIGRIEGDTSRRSQDIQGQDNAHGSPTKGKKGGKSKEAADRDATALAAGWLVLNQYTTICRAAGIPCVTVLTRYALQRTLMSPKDPPMVFYPVCVRVSCRLTRFLMRRGDPGVAFTDTAASHDCDLIILGSRCVFFVMAHAVCNMQRCDSRSRGSECRVISIL